MYKNENRIWLEKNCDRKNRIKILRHCGKSNVIKMCVSLCVCAGVLRLFVYKREVKQNKKKNKKKMYWKISKRFTKKIPYYRHIAQMCLHFCRIHLCQMCSCFLLQVCLNCSTHSLFDIFFFLVWKKLNTTNNVKQFGLLLLWCCSNNLCSVGASLFFFHHREHNEMKSKCAKNICI